MNSDIERIEDGRRIAEVSDLPGVMVYGGKLVRGSHPRDC